jgi:23S rRNA pseudouridine2605 synthase
VSFELTVSKDFMMKRPLLIDRVRRLGVPPEALPVNRLEFNTEGVCLLTNNGVFSRYLENDASMVREYKVRVHGLITPSKLEGLRRGLLIGGVKYKPLKVEVLPKQTSGTISWLQVVVSENRSKVLRTCFEHLYLKLLRVICTAYGPFKLGKLPPGSATPLTLPPDVAAAFAKYQIGSRRT